MRGSIAVVRQAYPDLPFCFSFYTGFDIWRDQDVSFLDLQKLHVWMAESNV